MRFTPIQCRVCGKICDITKKEDEDFVCGVCCDLDITDKVELREFLEKLGEKEEIIEDLRYVYDNNKLDVSSENIILYLIETFGGKLNW